VQQRALALRERQQVEAAAQVVRKHAQHLFARREANAIDLDAGALLAVIEGLDQHEVRICNHEMLKLLRSINAADHPEAADQHTYGVAHGGAAGFLLPF
jgi:hypothetical protein